MSLSDLTSIAIIVQGFFYIVSIFLVWYQLGENTKLVRAANTQKLVELFAPFNLQLVVHFLHFRPSCTKCKMGGSVKSAQQVEGISTVSIHKQLCEMSMN